MAAAGFKNMGPACCCCRDVIAFTGALSRLNNQDKFEFKRNIDFGLFNGIVTDVDHENKLAMVVHGASDFNLATREIEEPYTMTTLRSGVAAAGYIQASCDRVNRIVYYTVYNEGGSGLIKLWKVNYDGTGDTELCTLNVGATVGGFVSTSQPSIIYSRTNDKVYYIFRAEEVGTANDKYSIRCVNTDGTGDALVYECANQWVQFDSANADIIFHWDIDNTNERILFTEASYGGGPFYGDPPHKWRLREIGLDGTGSNIILETTQPRVSSDRTLMQYQGVQWSHKDQKIYTWEISHIGTSVTDTRGGFCSYDPDGTNREQLAPRSKNISDGTFGRFSLWCGFEKTGTGTEA